MPKSIAKCAQSGVKSQVQSAAKKETGVPPSQAKTRRKEKQCMVFPNLTEAKQARPCRARPCDAFQEASRPAMISSKRSGGSMDKIE
ncbi:MAG TPA: hypothetical protein VM406_07065 [Noviherbaspirillum sp.]|nr:hypothetical protein [Noviherbaspirillum sp.]